MIIGNNITVLKKSMEALWERQRVVSENISNATTPNYKRKYVGFEENFSKEIENLKRKNANKDEITSQVGKLRYEVKRDEVSQMNEDGNNVDVDYEFTLQARTQLQYEYAQRLLNDEYSRLRYAITGGN